MKIKNLKNGAVKVNFSNIELLKVNKVNDYIEISLCYRSKIKREFKKIPLRFDSLLKADNYLKPLGFQKFGEFYINLNHVCLIEKEIIEDSLSDINVTFYFNSSAAIEVRIKKSVMDSIENHRLVF